MSKSLSEDPRLYARLPDTAGLATKTDQLHHELEEERRGERDRGEVKKEEEGKEEERGKRKTGTKREKKRQKERQRERETQRDRERIKERGREERESIPYTTVSHDTLVQLLVVSLATGSYQYLATIH